MWSWGRTAGNDLETYRKGYPGKADNPRLTKNLEFYSNRIRSVPDGDLIENIHRLWRGDYRNLELHHGYIQWLFPIREDGLNYQAQELQRHEADAIARDPILQQRLITSYDLMLDFYGFVLVDRQTGEVTRAPHYVQRFKNLVNHPHNYLRITRILKCLGEMQLEHFKARWLHELIEESVNPEKGMLLVDAVDSLKNYWIGTVKDDTLRNQLFEHLSNLIQVARDARKQPDGKSTLTAPTPPYVDAWAKAAESRGRSKGKPWTGPADQEGEERRQPSNDEGKRKAGERDGEGTDSPSHHKRGRAPDTDGEGSGEPENKDDPLQ